MIYIDSTQCSTCSIDGLHRWNSLIDSVRLNKLDLSFLFIVSPPKWQLEDVFLAIESSGLKNDIYVDSLSIFSGVNPNLPQDIKYHSFILDMDNNPKLVGNVLENPSIRKIFDKLLSSKIE